jgi:hypothetical protein
MQASEAPFLGQLFAFALLITSLNDFRKLVDRLAWTAFLHAFQNALRRTTLRAYAEAKVSRSCIAGQYRPVSLWRDSSDES